MLIWKGMGFLVFVFVLCCSLVTNLVTDFFMGEAYWNEHQWPFGASLLVAALLSWAAGHFLVQRRARVLIDKNTGEEVVLTPDHSFFFIKMHWWGPILLVVGMIVIVKDLFL